MEKTHNVPLNKNKDTTEQKRDMFLPLTYPNQQFLWFCQYLSLNRTLQEKRSLLNISV